MATHPSALRRESNVITAGHVVGLLWNALDETERGSATGTLPMIMARFSYHQKSRIPELL
jgi:hypothetical protein